LSAAPGPSGINVEREHVTRAAGRGHEDTKTRKYDEQRPCS
jgi:hypothetical protein